MNSIQLLVSKSNWNFSEQMLPRHRSYAQLFDLLLSDSSPSDVLQCRTVTNKDECISPCNLFQKD